MHTWKKVAVLANALVIGFSMAAPATAATPITNNSLSVAHTNQKLESSTIWSEYEPPDNGGPDETGDAGTH
jgi:hypothetical protein